MNMIDTLSAAGPARPSRKPPRWLVVAFSTVSLTVLFAIIYAGSRPHMEWYVSPPIDAQGQRVHILCPAGWSRRATAHTAKVDGFNKWDANPIGPSIAMSAVKQNGIRELLAKLGLIPAEDYSDQTQLNLMISTGYPEGRATSMPHMTTFPNQGRDSKDLTWVIRGVRIQGTNHQVGVTYIRLKHSPESDVEATKVCESMFIR